LEGKRTNSLRYTGEQWDNDVGLLYLRARWYDPSVGRFTTRDPFPGLSALPQTQHPYVYATNNPINLTDPSGKIIPLLIPVGAAAVGAIIGGVGAGIAYAVTHPCESYLHSDGFWRAVGVGALSGGVAGLVGWAVPALLPAAGFWGTVGVGALSGSLASGTGQVIVNLFTPNAAWYAGVPDALLVGGVTGGIAGGVGYGIRQWLTAQVAASTAGNTSSPLLLEPPTIQKHHLFPQSLRGWFAGQGIDIDQYTVELSRPTHLSGVHGRGGFVGPGNVNLPGHWNALWQEFKGANPDATAKEMYQFAGLLMDRFGLSGLPIKPY
jgi:RHS repeat-associated protein